jgi:hypothetical protein
MPPISTIAVIYGVAVTVRVKVFPGRAPRRCYPPLFPAPLFWPRVPPMGIPMPAPAASHSVHLWYPGGMPRCGAWRGRRAGRTADQLPRNSGFQFPQCPTTFPPGRDSKRAGEVESWGSGALRGPRHGAARISPSLPPRPIGYLRGSL